MKRFNKVYLEISNICNLNCAFCPGTKRPPHAMTEAEFSFLLERIKPYTDYVYFHLMGEPLCHPLLEQFLQLAGEMGFRVILTTNGTLLGKCQQMLLDAPGLHKINISLHAFEANDLRIPFAEYLDGCLQFGKIAAGKKLVVYRLWNRGGADEKNTQILDALHGCFPGEWAPVRQGYRVADKVYLEFGDKFEWPDLSAHGGDERVFCYGLRDQIGILCDGTVVPCCLDHDGDLVLGNLFREDLERILNSPRAIAIFKGFQCRKVPEELCRKCGYARRFQ